MKITIVHGFFLPVPPVAGGAMEKSWWSLARHFALRGHDVVSLSRTWPGWPATETINGVQCRRIRGYDHTTSLRRNLVRDGFWGLRLLSRLPRADILITNTVLLPAIAPWLHPGAGRLVINLNRLPKGQLRSYFRVARLQVPSSAVADAVKVQCPRLLPVTRVFANPIDLELFSAVAPRQTDASPVRLGYIGRIHPEKGLDVLISAASLLQKDSTLPPWHLTLRGPVDIPRGGGGEGYLRRLRQAADSLLSTGQLEIAPPEFNSSALAVRYGGLDIFVYPSLAKTSETFGVGVAEAMAAGAVPIVSDLPCFRDLVRPGEDGLVFAHGAPDAVPQLAHAMAGLIRDPLRRRQLASSARRRTSAWGVEAIADEMLGDFTQLLKPR